MLLLLRVHLKYKRHYGVSICLLPELVSSLHLFAIIQHLSGQPYISLDLRNNEPVHKLLPVCTVDSYQEIGTQAAPDCKENATDPFQHNGDEQQELRL